jgi:hypothetical protein
VSASFVVFAVSVININLSPSYFISYQRREAPLDEFKRRFRVAASAPHRPCRARGAGSFMVILTILGGYGGHQDTSMPKGKSRLIRRYPKSRLHFFRVVLHHAHIPPIFKCAHFLLICDTFRTCRTCISYTAIPLSYHMQGLGHAVAGRFALGTSRHGGKGNA